MNPNPAAPRTPFFRTVAGQAMGWFALALAVRLAHLFFVLPSPLEQYPTSDENEIWALARHLANVDWLGRAWGPYFRPQLFSYVLAVLMRLTGGGILPLHFAIAVFDSAAVAGAWLLARQMFTRRAARWGALACALYWPFVHFSATLYMESFALLIQVLILLFLIKSISMLKSVSVSVSGSVSQSGSPALRRAPFVYLALAGFFCGLMLLTRPNVALAVPWLVLVPVLAVWADGGKGHVRQKWPTKWPVIWRIPFVFGASMLLALAPNAVRNQFVADQWLWLGGNGAINFYFGNNDRWVSMETVSPGLEWKLFVETPAAEAGIGPDRPARMEYWKRRFVDSVKREPGRFLSGLYDKTMLAFNARAIPCTANFAALGELSPVQRAMPGFGVLGPFAVLGLLLALMRMKGPKGLKGPQGRKGWARVLVLGYFAIILASIILLHVIERYRMLPLALIFLFSGVFVEEMRIAIRRRQGALIVGGAAALALAAVWINLPLTTPHLDTIERHWSQMNMGTACVGLGQFKSAEAHFLEAHRMLPNRLEPLNQLVNVCEKEKEHEEARAWHARLLTRLRAHYANYKTILADELARHVNLALAAKKPAEAVAAGREMIALIPQEPQAHYFLAVACKAAGDPAGAHAALDQTLALEPGHEEAKALLSQLGIQNSEFRIQNGCKTQAK